MSGRRLTIGEMFELIGVPVPAELEGRPFPGHVATDSRYVEPEGAFIALEGARTDGHAYLPQAVQKGAALVVVRRGKAPEDVVPCVELEDPERDMARLASMYLEKAFQGGGLKEIIAVTGSVGKTTTRTALQQLLKGRFRLHAADRSLNTRIGCTATVLAMPPDTEALLLEFGANKPGEIAELTELFPPTSAIITEVAPVHLEGFGSLEGVLRGKMEIAGSRRLRRLLYNADNPLLRDAVQEENVASVGMGDADYRIEALRFAMPTLTFRLQKRDRKKHADFSAQVWGEHLARPLAFAAALGNLLGMPLADCAEALRGFQALPGRGRVLSLPAGQFVVDDAYNANPLSMRASLETFVQVPGVKMAVLGEMREMGEDAPRYHQGLAPLLDKLEHVVLVGDLWRGVGEKFAVVPDWEEALSLVKKTDWTGLLVKGSNSVGLQNLVRALAEARP